MKPPLRPPVTRLQPQRTGPQPGEFRIVTERLELLPLTHADEGELHALYTDPAVRRQLWDDLIVDQLETDNAIRASLRSFRAHGYGLWRVQRRGDTALLGCCGLREVGPEAELTVAIDPGAQRRGYGREAATAVLRHALAKLRLRRVVALCDTGNHEARALARVLGLREQHVSRASGLDRTIEVVVHEATLADLPPTVLPLPTPGSGRPPGTP